MNKRTLFEKYGGFAAISRVVLSFYNDLLDSDEVGPIFDDVDMGGLVDHQTKFIASLLGGPSSYTQAQIKQIHERISITDAQYDETMKILADNLLSHGFSEEDTSSVMRVLEQHRDLVVGSA
ncbi:group I truncated hemoglobin [Sneathiella limimaris]|uniref:group I truncated hemoglobin n=1 Tax=Sneathiella limimaris TaxID=1964213 RepID=UPI00146A9F8D|nr:group 1 truncated hemoglobin [Sneathiella limimaris]